MLEANKIYHGDNLKILPLIDDNSIDSIVTDPQYGWSFMGKDWDKALPPQETYNECFRVLKHGAFMFWMSGARFDCLIENGIRIRNAGFIINFTPIFWAYASGFSKAGNIGKMVDKRWKSKTEYYELAEYLKEKRLEAKLSTNDIAKSFPSKTGGITGCYSNWEYGNNVPTLKQWKTLKKILQLNNKFDWLIEQKTKRYEEAEREVIGKKSWSSAKKHFHIVGVTGHSERTILDETAPSTNQAKALDGSYAGFQPKPAVEVIIVAMKPLSEKTYVDQAMKNKHGITWLDDCRIPYDENGITKGGCKQTSREELGYGYKSDFIINKEGDSRGRFPANLLVSDDVLNDGRIMQGSYRPSGSRVGKGKELFGWDKKTLNNEAALGYNDSGSFSRYFDLDAWWNERIKKLPKEVQKTFPFLIVPKSSKSEKNKGLDDLPDKEGGNYAGGLGLPGRTFKNGKWVQTGTWEKPNRLPRKNIHPTIKPLSLISYLITLGSREGDIILDPFIGSGTTAIACRLSIRNFIGIEIEKEYFDIATTRVTPYMEQKTFEDFF